MKEQMQKKIILDKYEVEKLLGRGTFASVYKAKSRANGAAETVAIKMIDKEDMEKAGMVEQIKREISVMRKVKHPNVVEIKEVMATKTKIYIVMEYLAGGELSHKLIRARILPENDARRYFLQLISAVEFCHNGHVYHRDLKLENLLLDQTHENVKVADFGLSASVEQVRGDGLLHTICGALSYMAPEVLQEKGYNGAKADVWSCGVILFALLSGMLPFQDESVRQMCDKIVSANYDFPPRFPPGARRLVSKMLDLDPDRRVSIEAIKRDPWLYRGVNRSISAANLSDLDQCNSSNPSPEFLSNRRRSRIGQNPGQAQLTTSASSPSFFNAFELISSMASGFDLSNLFEDRRKAATVFTSRRSEAEIVAAIEKMGRKGRRYEVEKVKGEFKVRLEAVAADGGGGGRKGPLMVTAEVFRAAPEVAVVEFTKDRGDAVEFNRFCEEEARPGLNDIVWTWKGDDCDDHLNSSAASSDSSTTSHNLTSAVFTVD